MVYAQDVQGQGHRAACLSRQRMLSEGVYAQDIQGQGHRVACLSRHGNSDEDRDLELDPDLLILYLHVGG